ncbi:MAG TPA: hypothetical protein VHT75_10105 [Acidimicrobiales bacterium]|jgi:hypothetical protein|nr:hypothetical protein [Acidimicrobiales bacterium]
MLCTPIRITNHAPATNDIGPHEWKLQQPSGILEPFTITGTLGIGQVAPGGAAGKVCFADSGQSATFFLLWPPLFRVGRGVWLLPVSFR